MVPYFDSIMSTSKSSILRSRTEKNKLKNPNKRALLREISTEEAVSTDITKKKQKVRFGGVGGSELVEKTPMTDFGTTCQPDSSEQWTQIKQCINCDSFDHIAALCPEPPNPTTRSIPEINCPSCRITTSHPSSSKKVVEIALCPGHRAPGQEDERKKQVRRKQAELIIGKFDNLLEIGVTETDALSILGIDQKKLERARSFSK